MNTQNFLGGKTSNTVGFQSANVFGQQQQPQTSSGLGQQGTSLGAGFQTQTNLNKPQGTLMFGTGTSSTSTSFFNPPGTSNTTQQQSTTGGFGQLGLSGQPQNQTGTGGSNLFGGQKSVTSGLGNLSGSFGSGTTTTTQTAQPFSQQMQLGVQVPQQLGSQQGFQGGIGMSSLSLPLSNQQISPKVFSLTPNNFMKLDKVETLPEALQNIVKDLEKSLKSYDIQLDYSTSVINTLFEHYNFLNSEAVKVIKFCKLINTKKSKINFLIQNIKSEINQQNNLLEKSTKDYKIIVENHNMKIQAPNEYFSLLNKELEEKISLQIQQISDLEALINLHYRKEFGSFQINSDLVEQTIKELYTSLIGLVTEAAKIKEYVNIIKQRYTDLMRYNYSYNEYDLEKRLRESSLILEEKDIFSKMK